MKRLPRAYHGKVLFHRYLLPAVLLSGLVTAPALAGGGERDLVVGTVGWIFEQFAKDLAVLRTTAVERVTGKSGLLLFACSHGKRRMHLMIPPASSPSDKLPREGRLMFQFIMAEAAASSIPPRYAAAELRPGLSINIEEGAFSDQAVGYLVEGLSNAPLALDLTVFIAADKERFGRGERVRLRFDKTQDMRLASTALLAACNRID